MVSFLRLLWIDLRRSQGYWLVPLMVALAPQAVNVMDRGDVELWADASVRVMQIYAVIAPLAAALAAWLVGRDMRRRVELLADSLPTSAFLRDLRTTLVATCWGLLGFTLAGAWLAAPAVREATWGGPNWRLILLGALAFPLFAAIGTLIGRLVRSRFAPLLTLVLTFGLTMATVVIQQRTTHFDPSGTIVGYQSTQPMRYLMPWAYGDSAMDPMFIHPALVRDGVMWMACLTAVVVCGLAVARS
jgi:hypothetical protein